jgi:hypothetical protein
MTPIIEKMSQNTRQTSETSKIAGKECINAFITIY